MYHAAIFIGLLVNRLIDIRRLTFHVPSGNITMTMLDIRTIDNYAEAKPTIWNRKCDLNVLAGLAVSIAPMQNSVYETLSTLRHNLGLI